MKPSKQKTFTADVVGSDPGDYSSAFTAREIHEPETPFEISRGNDKVLRKKTGWIAVPTDDSSEAETTLKISNDKIV